MKKYSFNPLFLFLLFLSFNTFAESSLILDKYVKNIVDQLNRREYVAVKHLQNEQFGQPFFEENKELISILDIVIENHILLNDFLSFGDSTEWIFETCSYSSSSPIEKRFINLEAFMAHKTSDNCKYLSTNRYVEGLKTGVSSEKEDPQLFVNKLFLSLDDALRSLNYHPTESKENSAKETILAMLYLEKYYAFKIQGALYQEKFRLLNKKKKEHQRFSAEAQTQAAIHWKMYAEIVLKQGIKSVWFSNITIDDFEKIDRLVMYDITLAKGAI